MSDSPDRTDETVAAYDACAARYAEKFTDFALYEAPRRDFAALLSDGARVLDLGCGPGTVSIYLDRLGRGFTFSGGDLSREMVARARHALPTGSFEIVDLRAPLPFVGPFDAIVASFCIVHLDAGETEALLARLAPLARSGSHLLLAWIEGATSGFETATFSAAQRFWYCRHQGAWLRAQLERAGWQIVDERRVLYTNSDGSVEPEGFIFARWP